MVEDFIKYIIGEWRVISQAPATFLIAIVIIGGALLYAISYAYSVRLANRDTEITLLTRQRDDYKEKLGGASPDAAKAKMEMLEERLAGLDRLVVRPRRLSQQQSHQIATAIRSLQASASIAADISCLDCRRYADDFAAAMSGWQVITGAVAGIRNPPPTGIQLSARDLNSPEAQALMAGLRAAGVQFDTSTTARTPTSVELVIAAPP